MKLSEVAHIDLPFLKTDGVAKQRADVISYIFLIRKPLGRNVIQAVSDETRRSAVKIVVIDQIVAVVGSEIILKSLLFCFYGRTLSTGV